MGHCVGQLVGPQGHFRIDRCHRCRFRGQMLIHTSQAGVLIDQLRHVGAQRCRAPFFRGNFGARLGQLRQHLVSIALRVAHPLVRLLDDGLGCSPAGAAPSRAMPKEVDGATK